MHKGAPAHTACSTQALSRACRINILPCSSCSLDLNPIKHIWDMIGRNVRARDPHYIRELERADLDVWNRVEQHVCREYVLSMRSRCRATINANGGHTRFYFNQELIISKQRENFTYLKCVNLTKPFLGRDYLRAHYLAYNLKRKKIILIFLIQ